MTLRLSKKSSGTGPEPSVLITGISGFAGKHLASRLAELGCRITGTVFRNRPVSTPFKLVKTDFRSRDQVFGLFERKRYDAVVHLAAESIPRFSWKRPEETLQLNTAGTIYLLEAIRRYSPGTRLLFASTNQVWGRAYRCLDIVRENSVRWPESPYAVSKALAENACLNYHSVWGVDVVIARPFNHLGIGQRPDLVLSDWCRQIAAAEIKGGPRFLKVGNIETLRDFLHIRDVVSAYECMLENGIAGETYTVCTGRAEVLSHYVDHLVTRASVPIKVRIEKARMRKNDPPVMRGGNRALRALGWRPRHTAFEALDELLGYWRSEFQGHSRKSGTPAAARRNR